MRLLKLVVLACVIILLSGCYTYSSLQSARLVRTGKYEITPSYSSVSFSNEGHSEKMTDNLGVQIGFGMSDKMNLRFRFENINPDYKGIDSYSFLALEPKFSLMEDRVALSLPVGFFTGGGIDESDTWQIHPSLHFTFPVNDFLEVNLSPRVLLFLEEDTDDFVALNAGLGISNDFNKWVIRPEIGYMFSTNSDVEGHFFAFSLGLSFTPSLCYNDLKQKIF